jgi:hypothetical protein
MVHLVQTVQLSCTNTKTVYKRTKMRFHMTHITYGSRLCVYGTFCANYAPILRQDLHYLQMEQTELHQTLVA